MCQGPNREGGSGHQKKNEDEDEDGKMGNVGLVHVLSFFFTLFHLLFLFIFTYLFFCASDQRMLLFVAVGCCVCTTAQKVPDIHSLHQGAARFWAAADGLQLFCWGQAEMADSAEPDRTDAKERRD